MIRSKERILAKKKRLAIHGALVLLVTVATGCASYQRITAATESQQGVARVTGTVTYRIRMILPTDALIRVDLVDIRAQAPALTIGPAEIETRGQVSSVRNRAKTAIMTNAHTCAGAHPAGRRLLLPILLPHGDTTGQVEVIRASASGCPSLTRISIATFWSLVTCLEYGIQPCGQDDIK
jgi:hypothetical protein